VPLFAFALLTPIGSGVFAAFSNIFNLEEI
jgi:hypothetical protein